MDEAVKTLRNLTGYNTYNIYGKDWWVVGIAKLPNDVIIYSKIIFNSDSQKDVNFRNCADLIAFVYTSTGKIIELHYDDYEYDEPEFTL